MDPLKAQTASAKVAADNARRKRPKMSRIGRAAARKRLPGRIATGVPKTMPSATRPANGDMGLGNPNDVGAVIIPQ
jgi:hypothetical protein